MNEGWVLESCSQTAVQSGSFRLTLFVGSLVLLGFLLAWNPGHGIFCLPRGDRDAVALDYGMQVESQEMGWND